MLPSYGQPRANLGSCSYGFIDQTWQYLAWETLASEGESSDWVKVFDFPTSGVCFGISNDFLTLIFEAEKILVIVCQQLTSSRVSSPVEQVAQVTPVSEVTKVTKK